MKKFVSIIFALCLVFGMTTGAMAAYQVEVKTNSEGITAEEGACEKFGNLTFIFDSGTQLFDGDWWYADLPLGVTLCQSINFAVAGATFVAGAGAIPSGGVGPNGVFPAAVVATAADDGASVTNGFWTVKDTVAGDGLNGAITTGAGSDTGVWFRVTGTSGSSRVLIKVYDDEGDSYSNAQCIDGSSNLVVGAGTEFQIKLFDGQPQVGWGFNDTDTTTATQGQYGDDVGDALQATNAYDNSYCGAAYGYASSTINVSISSGGTQGNNFLTFNPSGPEVAHTIAATVIQLAACKTDTYGYVSLAGGQGAVCTFDYDAALTPAAYCADVGTANFRDNATIAGNRVFIQNTSGNFFDSGDNFQVILRTSGNGAYFSGAGGNLVNAFYSANTTYCDAAPGASEANIDGAGAWATTTESGATFTTWATGAGCGTIATGQAVNKLTSPAFGGIDDCNLLWVNVPRIVFDPAQFSEGDQVTLYVEFWRLPCGAVFTGSRVIAEFVDTCPAAAPATTLLFPYAVALDGSSGWWFGMSFCNPTLANAAAGTALITIYEDDGDVGTYTTPSIAVGDMVTLGGAELLALLTADVGNTGTLGDARCHIIAVCQFQGAGGFGMMGNTEDSTGYVAYGNSALWVY